MIICMCVGAGLGGGGGTCTTSNQKTYDTPSFLYWEGWEIGAILRKKFIAQTQISPPQTHTSK